MYKNKLKHIHKNTEYFGSWAVFYCSEPWTWSLNTGSLNLHKHFGNGGQQAVISYLVENDLKVLRELLVGGFSKDDIDFGRILNSVMDEGEIEEI